MASATSAARQVRIRIGERRIVGIDGVLPTCGEKRATMLRAGEASRNTSCSFVTRFFFVARWSGNYPEVCDVFSFSGWRGTTTPAARISWMSPAASPRALADLARSAAGAWYSQARR